MDKKWTKMDQKEPEWTKKEQKVIQKDPNFLKMYLNQNQLKITKNN